MWIKWIHRTADETDIFLKDIQSLSLKPTSQFRNLGVIMKYNPHFYSDR